MTIWDLSGFHFFDIMIWRLFTLFDFQWNIYSSVSRILKNKAHIGIAL